MDGERAAKEAGRLRELTESQVAETLAGERAKMIRVPGQRLAAVSDRPRIVLYEVPDRRALVPPLGEPGCGRDELAEDVVGRSQILPFHGCDALAQQRVE